MVLLLILSVALIILMTVKLKVHPFIALLLTAIFYGINSGMPLQEIVNSINTGFGNTLGGIGLIIILGVIIGAFLENSGGAYTLASKVLKLTGKKRIPEAMGLLGWIVCIPVFADSGFMLLAPLNKSLTKKAKITLAGAAVALAVGLLAAHTMVPPTPGPIAAAHYLEADLGMVMLIGVPVSLFAVLAGIFFAKTYVSKTYIDPNPEVTEEEISKLVSEAPSALKSTLPIVVPIVLIVLKSVLTSMGYSPLEAESSQFPINILFFLGEPFIALLIGMFLAFLLPKKLNKDLFSTSGWIGKALTDASSILLITGAGGIFGQVLRDSGIAIVLGDAISGLNLGIWLPFLLAAAIKTAQGSSTVALITAASIIAPLMHTLGFDSEIQKAMAVVAIGAGSAVISHANDSFFWVVTRLSGMDVKTGYRLVSSASFVLGFSAALLLSLISIFI
ncbi:predicted D-glycerate permease [Flavobacteriaceae bacterium MAR_2010_188]|nr:predicted D-glycerate permease [Flavobacteriaceae bacterium MAR_2010_188]